MSSKNDESIVINRELTIPLSLYRFLLSLYRDGHSIEKISRASNGSLSYHEIKSRLVSRFRSDLGVEEDPPRLKPRLDLSCIDTEFIRKCEVMYLNGSSPDDIITSLSLCMSKSTFMRHIYKRFDSPSTVLKKVNRDTQRSKCSKKLKVAYSNLSKDKDFIHSVKSAITNITSNICIYCKSPYRSRTTENTTMCRVCRCKLGKFVDGVRDLDYVECPYCYKRLSVLNSTHLATHGKTKEDVVEEHRDAKFYSKNFLNSKVKSISSCSPGYVSGRYAGTRVVYKKRDEIHVVLRSKWEERFAAYLDTRSDYWEYESKRFKYRHPDGIDRIYIPDFFVPSTNTFYEVKPFKIIKERREEVYRKYKSCIECGYNYYFVIGKYLNKSGFNSTMLEESNKYVLDFFSG